MNHIKDDMIAHRFLSVRTYGQPMTLPAVISNGTLLNGTRQYIAIDNRSDACISSMARCYQHGLTLSMWTNFRRLRTGMFYLSTGNGIKVGCASD